MMQSIRRPLVATHSELLGPPPQRGVAEWKTTRTVEGHAYYYNTRTRESTWERPKALGGPYVYKVGDEVEVWSNSQRVWGKGKVKQVDSGKVITEFTLPTGGMARKEMLAAHKDLRLAEARVETESWSDDELAMYRQCFEKVSGASDTKTLAPIVLFLSSSGLPQSALKQVWAVANPGDKQKLGFEEFARCCRLVAHCQALAAGPGVRLVKEGGRPLRVKLRVECIFRRPSRLPTFDGRAPCLAAK